MKRGKRRIDTRKAKKIQRRRKKDVKKDKKREREGGNEKRERICRVMICILIKEEMRDRGRERERS
eukprot:1335016-Amorphochlora_amoeboformis.AAC.1